MDDRPANSNPAPTGSSTAEIKSVCQRFEAAWKAGGRPRIEEYLGAATVGPFSAPISIRGGGSVLLADLQRYERGATDTRRHTNRSPQQPVPDRASDALQAGVTDTRKQGFRVSNAGFVAKKPKNANPWEISLYQRFGGLRATVTEAIKSPLLYPLSYGRKCLHGSRLRRFLCPPCFRLRPHPARAARSCRGWPAADASSARGRHRLPRSRFRGKVGMPNSTHRQAARKPAGPQPDFPPFPQAEGRWRKTSGADRTIGPLSSNPGGFGRRNGPRLRPKAAG